MAINNPYDFDLGKFDAGLPQTTNPPTLPKLPPGGAKMMPPLATLPPSRPVVKRSTINSVARRPVTIQGSALGEYLGPMYGRCMPPRASIYAAVIAGDYLYLGVAWGVGEVDSLETAYFNGEAIPAGVTATHYTGTTTQTADPTLAGVIAGYTDTLVYSVRGSSLGVVHSVFKIPSGAVSGEPQISAAWKGRKVYDPRTPATVYSTNPALHLADLLSNTLYGAGRTMDWSSVGDAADACDTLVNGAKRREMGLAIDRRADMSSWVEVLRAYAGCFVVQRGGSTLLIADRPSTATRTISQFPQDGKFAVVKRGNRDVPTVVRVDYTDTTQVPWRLRPAYYYDTGVEAGTTRYDESNIILPGIQSHERAYREAKERLLKLKITDSDLTAELWDDGLQDEAGDVVNITHPLGFTAKPFRLLSVSNSGSGPIHIVAAEYNASVYSDDAQAATSESDTTYESPLTPPGVAAVSLVLSEDFYQKKDGVWASRIMFSWVKPDYPYTAYFEAQLRIGNSTIWTGTTPDGYIPSTPALEEGVSHEGRVRLISTSGAQSVWASKTITPDGETEPPGPVLKLTAYEIGGQIYMNWPAVVALGVLRYVIRIGPTASSFASLGNYEVTSGIRYTTRDIVEGTYKVWVAAMDATGNIGVPASKEVVVTVDATAVYVGSTDFSTWGYGLYFQSGCYTWDREQGAKRTWFSVNVTDTVNSQFLTTNALNAYPNPWITYHSSVTSYIFINDDYGAEVSAQFQGSFGAQAIDGSTISIELGLSTDGSTFDWDEALIRKGTARYAGVQVTSLTANTFLFEYGNECEVRVDMLEREERGTCTTQTGTFEGRYIILLENRYTQFSSISLTGKYASGGQITVQYDAVLMDQPGSWEQFTLWSWVDGVLTGGVEVSWLFRGM